MSSQIVNFQVAPDGRVLYYDQHNKQYTEGRIVADFLWREKGRVLHKLDRFCAERNQTLDRLLTVHWDTPSPVAVVQGEPGSPGSSSEYTVERRGTGLLGFLKRLFGRRTRGRGPSPGGTGQFPSPTSTAGPEKKQVGDATDTEEYARILEQQCANRVFTKLLAVPSADMKMAAIIGQLPDLGVFPETRAEVIDSDPRARIVQLSEADRRGLRVKASQHGLFRIIGEAFSALPSIEVLAVSASDHIDRRDQYFLSYRIERETWLSLKPEFGNIADLDVPALLSGSGLRLSVFNGKLRPVEPYKLGIKRPSNLPNLGSE